MNRFAKKITSLVLWAIASIACAPVALAQQAHNLALNPSRTGFPHPLESDRGWGGGTDVWDILDGVPAYTWWANGLAFTLASRPRISPCGWRQATINFGKPVVFNRVLVWHHGDDHIPNTYKIQYWNGSNWVDVFSTTSGRSYVRWDLRTPPDLYASVPTENRFSPVTSDKVRFLLQNCDITHGWIYEFEVFEPSCSVSPLSPITDPIAQQFEAGQNVDTAHLTPEMQAALNCFETAVVNAGGNFVLTSAWRPPAYQHHLQEVWDKWMALQNKTGLECQALRNQVQAEFTKHQLVATRRPGSGSPPGPHSNGEAIDVGISRINLPINRVLDLADGCGDLYRPHPITDPVHFERRP